MAPTRRQIRQLIREELSRALREVEEPVVIDWREGPIDEEWVDNRVNLYSDMFDNDIRSFKQVAYELVDMLEGEPTDPSIAKHYLNPDGTSKYTRASVEDLATKMLNILDDVAARQAEIDRRRALRESRSDRDVTGYEYLKDERKKMRPLPHGPVDDAWVAEKLADLNGRFPPFMLPMLADDFAKAAVGRGDPDVAMRYLRAGVTRETMEALVSAMGGVTPSDEG